MRGWWMKLVDQTSVFNNFNKGVQLTTPMDNSCDGQIFEMQSSLVLIANFSVHDNCTEGKNSI